MEQRKRIELTIPTIDLSLLKKLKGGYTNLLDPAVITEQYDPDWYKDRSDDDPGQSQDDDNWDSAHDGDSSSQGSEEGGVSYNLERALEFLRNHAKPHYDKNTCGYCASAVRKALEAGGLSTDGRPGSATDYDDFLPTIGFVKVTYDSDYVPQPGDIVVHEAYEGHKDGHIAMYDGNIWISDYCQIDMFGGPGYRENNDFTIWRYNG